MKRDLFRSSFTLAVVCVAGCSSSAPRPELDVGYDDATKHILVSYGRGLEGGESLHARIRRGVIAQLDCTRDAASIERIDGSPAPAEKTWIGPLADAAMFENHYDTAWLELPEPTPQMLAEAAAGLYVIDVCLMTARGDVVAGNSFDIRRALDRTGGNGKADGDEERIASTNAYAEKCIEELGEIPFFEKLADGDYSTYNCLDSTILPTTVTGDDGTISRPETEVAQCDNPQYIYSLCEPNAAPGRTNGPRVASRRNEQGTHWVLLCRKANPGEGDYNDIAMIGTNPYTGKTCYFQNALYSLTDGQHVPHPADRTGSESSPQQSASLWQGIHGGIGGGIECARCHSTDPFIHTPWIDQALDATGEPVVPKMGQNEDFVLGYNESPYSIVNSAGQGWTMPKQLVSPEASACTRCHRIGADERWMESWIDRLVGEDSSWTSITTPAYRTFEHTFWMPPDVDGLDATTWEQSEFGRAVKFIQGCRSNPAACLFADVPTDPLGDAGTLPAIDLEGRDLAVASLAIFGADLADPSCPGGTCASRRCAECHTISRNSLRRWDALTDKALDTCNLKTDPDAMSDIDARAAIDCLRVDPSDPSSVFEAAKLGVLTTGVQYTDFRRLFQKAYGEAWLQPYTGFKARVGMPKGNHPKLSQKEYATLLKWFRSDLVELDVLPELPPPATCVESFDTPSLAQHLRTMSFEGWGAVNAENGIRMFGCTPGKDPRTCLTAKPDRSAQWGNGVGTVRELTKLAFRTSYWTRSSADGRFVGNGGGRSGATITDLQAERDIGVRASYDPGFFPDNSGFMFQGSVGGAGICAQSLLDTDTAIDFSETGCMSARGVNLYQHVARGINGGDYFIINSQFVSDPGRDSRDPDAFFNASSTMKFTPMIFNGTTYEQLPAVVVDSPYEGDSVLSPSTKLVASRLSGPEGRSLGYVVRKVSATKSGTNYRISTDQRLATICESGAKPNFSFDERFLVTHHYHDGRADIILIDLSTGQRRQVTNMPEGTYAQFPHFRSDGWFYFLVVEGNREYIAASDAALQVSAP